MAVVSISFVPASVFLSPSATVTITVSPERYATSLLSVITSCDTVGVGEGCDVIVGVGVNKTVGVGDTAAAVVGVGTIGADSVVKLHE
ncbi:hypothetical protein KsCSTR_27100 [Candidatus Kuenenia stuttgartiensis]|uniref:Uncharacterized protein n=1 Tax=Kuenenia stuttgartiensis TaxID=174633 RepID=A0A2C9CL55_KUEST|nr:hypothetical protein KsCSTR_27100 [Candidatus Kuenenia stuttgartiensis]SOH06375.1 hypothetical protein KSMBR1_3903 [Candidatus Kuenenia stuttgartiensis]